MPGSTLRRIAASAGYTLLWCAGLGVLVEDVLLLRQNHHLRDALDGVTSVTSGTRLQNLAAVSLAGSLEQIRLPSSDSERLLIISFSAACQFCLQNRPGWLALTAELKARRDWRVVWVSRDPVAFTAEHLGKGDASECEILADPPYRTYLQLGMGAVPKTIAVGAGGVVERVWEGKLQPAEWNQIASYFQVSPSALSSEVSNPRDLRN